MAHNLANNLWGKCLLVDDELASQTLLNNKNLLVPPENILFAADYEAAYEMLLKHQDLNAYFFDVRIPKNSNPNSTDYRSEEQPDWGIVLLDNLEKLNLENKINKQAKVEVFSAQVTQSYIKKQIAKYIQTKTIDVRATNVKDKTENLLVDRLNNVLRNKSYRYSLVKDDDLDIVLHHTQRIRDSYKTLVEKAIDIGESLTEVKKRLKRGQFQLYITSEVGMTPRTSQRYMNVYKIFKLNRPEKDLYEENFVPTALFALAEPSVPESAREEAIERAKQGEKISVKLAFEITENAKQGSKTKNISAETEDCTPSITTVSISPNTQQSPSTQKIVKLIPQQSVWHLGQHFLFCAEPNSAQFLEQLPRKINLNLAFPENRKWSFNYPYQIDSGICFFSIYQQDLDPMFFKTSIDEVIKSTTEDNNVASICYCPNPIIFQVAHDLGLRCFIAEPNRSKCKDIVTYWNNA